MRALLLTLLRGGPARASITTTKAACQFVALGKAAHGFADVDANGAGKARHNPVASAK